MLHLPLPWPCPQCYPWVLPACVCATLPVLISALTRRLQTRGVSSERLCSLGSARQAPSVPSISLASHRLLPGFPVPAFLLTFLPALWERNFGKCARSEPLCNCQRLSAASSPDPSHPLLPLPLICCPKSISKLLRAEPLLSSCLWHQAQQHWSPLAFSTRALQINKINSELRSRSSHLK